MKNDAWHDVGELREYCYYVAGVVGEMLTAMFTSLRPAALAAEDELMRLAPSVGESLQLINMIRDYQTDNERKRLYFSERSLLMTSWLWLPNLWNPQGSFWTFCSVGLTRNRGV